MADKKRRTLSDQLIGRQIILLAILLLVVGVSQYLILRHVLFHSTARTLRDEISVLAPIIHHTLSERGIVGFTHIATVLVSRLRAPGVEVVITNAVGHVMASSSTLKAAVPPLYSTPYFLWNHRIVVDSVIGNHYYPSGYVWLLSSVHPIYGILQRDAELYVFLACISLIMAGWLGSVSVRQTLHPLEVIRESTQKIAAGEFGQTTSLANAPAEIHDLAESIDSMSESINTLFTQEKELSDQMRRFVADASHELRTPLTAINGFLDLISSGGLTPEEEHRGLMAMRAQGQRMGRLVNQLLTLSRIDSAPSTLLTIIPVHVDRWLRDLHTEIDNLVKPRRVEFDVVAATIDADPDRLTEVLFNLLDNIARYTPQDTRVRLASTTQAEMLHMVIEDNGPGIAVADFPHIFDRFYRGDRARTSSSGGSGLGLSIAQSLLRAQGGDIEVSPVTPHGTRFTIILPLTAARS